jgi:hypothetical protein
VILAAMLLQVAEPGLPASVVIPGSTARPRSSTAPGVAIDTFRDVCLSHLRDRAAIARAARRAGLRLAPDSRSDLGGDTYERGDLTLHYNSAGTLHPLQDQPQCFVRTWLDGRIGEGAFERRFVARVKPGALTRTGPVRIWERTGSDGRVERIGLQTRLLSHGQINAILSTGLRPEQSN